MEDLTQEFLVENSSMNVEFLENTTGGITAGAYLLSIADTVVINILGTVLYLLLTITF